MCLLAQEHVEACFHCVTQQSMFQRGHAVLHAQGAELMAAYAGLLQAQASRPSKVRWRQSVVSPSRLVQAAPACHDSSHSAVNFVLVKTQFCSLVLVPPSMLPHASAM